MKAILLTALLWSVFSHVDAESYGDKVGNLDSVLALQLGLLYQPNEDGAIGRNKSHYIHARFQRGLHHLADLSLVSKNCQSATTFINAASFALERQKQDGDFKLVLPDLNLSHTEVSHSDRVSGVAIFVSSLGLGVHALDSSDWFHKAAECGKQRASLAIIKTKLAPSLEYLIRHKETLIRADATAPNRLLFDAIAFQTLAVTLNSERAFKLSRRFSNRALRLFDEEHGHFIEAGGYDSSYNGVATALALRFVLLGTDHRELATAAKRALNWQLSRILPSGEVSVTGNTRVKRGSSGETFLGRKKDVDVGHTIEALMLGSMMYADPHYEAGARRVLQHYRRQ